MRRSMGVSIKINMKEYMVIITETLQKRVIIQGEDEQDAFVNANEAYNNQDIVLDSSDFVDYDIQVETEIKPDDLPW